MGRGWKLAGLGLFLSVAVISLAGCGSNGPTAEEKQEARRRQERVEEKKAEAIAFERRQQCETQLGGFLEALEELDARLEVGLTYAEYSQELGSIQVAYNRLPINELDPRCLGRVGLPSENAFQEFTAAGEAWDECIEALSCEDGISPEVQNQWLKGSEKLKVATGLGMTEVGAPTPADFTSIEQGGGSP
jgi:hypothetical protein